MIAQARKYSGVRTRTISVSTSVRSVNSSRIPASSEPSVRRAWAMRCANSMDSVCTSGNAAACPSLEQASRVIPSKPMITQATPPSTLSSRFWMLSRKGLAIVSLRLYPLPIRGSSFGEDARRQVGCRNVDQARLARGRAENEADLVAVPFLVDRQPRQYAGVQTTRGVDRQSQLFEQHPGPRRQLRGPNPHRRPQVQGHHHTQRDGLTVKQVVSGGGLEGVADGVTEVEDRAPAPFGLVGRDHLGLDPHGP